MDLGIKSFAVVSDGREFPNVNHTRKVRKPEKKLKREQRRLSRKRESQKKNSEKGKIQANGIKNSAIPLRVVDRWYPSSKTCHFCDTVKSDLKLSDRSYACEGCGKWIDRDLNAALNIRDTTQYVLA